MTSKPLAKPKRERGLILTLQGWHKLQQAKQATEVEFNWGRRFTHEQLSERTGLSLHTVSRILLRQERVDRQSLVHGSWHDGFTWNPGIKHLEIESYLYCSEDMAVPQGEWGWHPRMSSRLGLFRLVQMPGSHEVMFSNPAGLAEKIIAAGRD